MRTRLGMVVAAAVLVGSVAATGAEQGSVVTKDGRTISGEITEEGDQVRVNRGGILIVLSRDEVQEIRTAAKVGDEYRRRLAELSRDDVAGHYKLAEWCRDRGRLDLGVERCEHVLAIAPDHANAKLLLKALNRRINAKSGTGPQAKSPKGKTSQERRKEVLLTKEQINRIRMAELKPGERVTVRFGRKVVDRFLKAVAGTEKYSRSGYREEFLARRRHEQLAEIVEATGMFFADDIQIQSDPEAIRVFRRDIMPIIRANCATLSCHGAGGTSKIRLQTKRTPDALYTNFYTLDRFEKGVAGRDVVRMFDRGYPDDGFFTNYLLPSDLADPALAHPGQIEPVVRDKEDRRYEQVVVWLKEVLRRPRQDPGIDESAAKGKGDSKAGPGTRPVRAKKKRRPEAE